MIFFIGQKLLRVQKYCFFLIFAKIFAQKLAYLPKKM